ncbi:ATP-binding protein [Sanguibacter sp. 25GB23B1]|uniref:HAMP domain-containing sensor histidine kinase n=1 Tax=unclassified Sanguibacter TaxID=2645534 RepID=UPI0032AF6080
MRGKILAALAVPVLVLFLAASIFSFQSIRDLQVAGQSQDIVALLDQGEVVTTALQTEREASVAVNEAPQGREPEIIEARRLATAALTAARADTNSSLDSLRASYAELDISLLDPAVTATLVSVSENNQTLLVSVRDFVNRKAGTSAVISDRYSALVLQFLKVPQALADELTDRQVAGYLSSYVSAGRLIDAVRSEGPLVQKVLNTTLAGQAIESEQRNMTAVIAGTDAARETASTSVAALDIPQLIVERPGGQYTSMRQILGTGETERITAPLADQWAKVNTDEINSLVPLQGELSSLASDAASNEVADARTVAIYTILITVVTVLASILIALLISRRITVPLRNLAKAAQDVRAELPKLVEQVSVPGQGPELTLTTITVESTDEVGQLAAAFNDVNSTTVEVAREQAALRGSIAEMFVNVARRDHVLLNRQLAFLDELERSEEDANVLANLFRLDHLATRMRRNSESLLVLAGIDSGRRVRQPMPVSDVVRTASSEIELYDRVRLNLEADPLILGHNALNAAHLIAELLENATMFSEPHSPVEVTTNRTSRYVTVEVRDHGLGMSPEDIEAANTKVASRSASDVIGVQRLGLFVVGRLADRLGAHVLFARASDGSAGTVATVSFPGSLFVDDNDVPLQGPTDPLSASNRQATEQWMAPEAEMAVPVDLEALTDGSTSIGMPRRRSSVSTSETPAVATSTPDASDTQSAMVLPPLESANPAIDLSSPGDLNWSPAQALDERLPLGLPSRARNTEAPAAFGHLEPLQDEPILDGERRSAMFNKFRTRSSVDADATTDQPTELEQEQEQPVEAPAAFEPEVGLTHETPMSGGGVLSESRFDPSELTRSQYAIDDYESLPATGLGEFDSQYAQPDAYAPLEEQAPQDEYVAADEYVAQHDAVEHDEQPFSTSRFERPQDVQPEPQPMVIPGLEPDEDELLWSPQEEVPAAQWQDDDAPAWQPEQQWEPQADSGESTFEPVQRYESLPAIDSSRNRVAPEPQPFEPVQQFEPLPAFGSSPRAEAPAPRAPEPDVFEPVQRFEPLPGAENRSAPVDAPSRMSDLSQGFQQQQAFQQQQQGFQEPQGFQPVERFEPLPAAQAPESPVAPPAAPPLRTRGSFGDPTPQSQSADEPYRPIEQHRPIEQQRPLEQQRPPEQYRPTEPPVQSEQRFEPTPRREPAQPERDEPVRRPEPTRAEAQVESTPQWAPTVGSTPALPSFADVVADAPTRRGNARHTAETTRRGPFAWLRRRGEDNEPRPATSEVPVQRTEAPQAARPMFVPEPVQAAAPIRHSTVTAGQPFEPQPRPGQAFEPSPEPARDQQASRTMRAQQFAPLPADQAAPQQPLRVGPPAPTESRGNMWSPHRPGAAPQPGAGASVPVTELPLSGLDAGESWTPPSQINGDIASMLAMRSNIQEQALAELSQLSAYRPAAVETEQAGGLTRRTRGQVAASTDDVASQKISRDAAELRSRLSAFQSATSRGRQMPGAEPADNRGADRRTSDDGTVMNTVPDSAPRPR